MRGLVATTAVLGVLAIGGLPALALTLAAEETRPDAEPTTTLVQDPDDTGRPGRPPWAQGEDREPPPGWTRNHGGATPHGWAVREWASCMGDAAAGREPGAQPDPSGACGEKPLSPGQAKKELGAAGQPPGQQGRDEAPGQAKKLAKSKKPKG